MSMHPCEISDIVVASVHLAVKHYTLGMTTADLTALTLPTEEHNTGLCHHCSPHGVIMCTKDGSSFFFASV